jgi:cell division protein FtsA
MDNSIVVGIDIGSTKICTLVAHAGENGHIQILGVGIEPSQGVKKGNIVDLAAVSNAIAHSIDQAERSSGLEITSSLVSIAGSHVTSLNNRGVVGISRQVIDQHDLMRAMDTARAVPIPHNREVIHVIHRGFTVDEQDGIRMPIGMHGYRLEVEAHIITAAASTLDNLRQCVAASGVEASQFVLNPLASAEVVLTETEREMGAVVCDIGGGTTDMAIFIDGDVWHTMVMAVGGNHITSDIAHGLRLPFSQAEEIKLRHGHAITREVSESETFTVKAFGSDMPVNIKRKDLTHIIEARVEEIFNLVSQEIKRSGYDGLLPAGLVLTGGSSEMTGIRDLASEVLGLPVRMAQPDNITGLADKLRSPAYSTSVGLIKWAMLMNEFDPGEVLVSNYAPASGLNWDKVRKVLKVFLP